MIQTICFYREHFNQQAVEIRYEWHHIFIIRSFDVSKGVTKIVTISMGISNSTLSVTPQVM